ncbi:hypothetical protein LXL04_028200 [Taraxacum kok-saghyz]
MKKSTDPVRRSSAASSTDPVRRSLATTPPPTSGNSVAGTCWCTGEPLEVATFSLIAPLLSALKPQDGFTSDISSLKVLIRRIQIDLSLSIYQKNLWNDSSTAPTRGQLKRFGADTMLDSRLQGCSTNGSPALPNDDDLLETTTFAFDTFGFLAPEAVDLLNRVQRVMHSNVMTPKSMDVVFQRVSFAIQKGVAAQLVAHVESAEQPLTLQYG